MNARRPLWRRTLAVLTSPWRRFWAEVRTTADTRRFERGHR